MAEYTIVLTRSARKELENLPLSISKRITSAIEVLAADQRPTGVRKLQGAKTSGGLESATTASSTPLRKQNISSISVWFATVRTHIERHDVYQGVADRRAARIGSGLLQPWLSRRSRPSGNVVSAQVRVNAQNMSSRVKYDKDTRNRP